MKILFVQKVKALVGSEKYFLELVPELEKRGIETQFICIYNQADKAKALVFIEAYKNLNLSIHVKMVSSDKSIIQTLSFIRSIAKQDNFDLIHSHLIHADFWTTTLKRLGQIKCPIVSTKHGYDENYISKHGFDGKNINRNLYFKLCKFSEKKIDKSYAVSNGLKQLFIDSTICKAQNITTIHHGFDFENVNSKINSKFRFSKHQLVLLGRIIPFKGHLLALKALAEVKTQIPNFKLLIIGHGDKDLIAELKSYITKNNLTDNVEFLGYKSNIYDYLVNSDVMLVPSIAEGFGLIFLEAMNANLPIIGFDVPATNEIVTPNETGILIPPYETNLMAKAIVNLLTNESFRNKLSQGAKQKLKSYFSLKRMVDETVAFYEGVL